MTDGESVTLMRTWMWEALAVAAVLGMVAFATGNEPVEWVGAAAVLLSFCHGQVADRLSEKEAARARPEVECHRWERRYFVGKEALWLAYFVLHQTWTALAGVGLFLLYPAWRRWWRS